MRTPRRASPLGEEFLGVKRRLYKFGVCTIAVGVVCVTTWFEGRSVV